MKYIFFFEQNTFNVVSSIPRHLSYKFKPICVPNSFYFQFNTYTFDKKKQKRKQTCKSVNEICLNCSQVTISFFFTSFQSFLSTTLLVIAVVGSELFCFFRNCTNFLATRGPTPTQQHYLSMATIELMYSDQAIDELTMETTFVTLVDRTSMGTELNYTYLF